MSERIKFTKPFLGWWIEQDKVALKSVSQNSYSIVTTFLDYKLFYGLSFLVEIYVSEFYAIVNEPKML